jgi:hypothetical protein
MLESIIHGIAATRAAFRLAIAGSFLLLAGTSACELPADDTAEFEALADLDEDIDTAAPDGAGTAALALLSEQDTMRSVATAPMFMTTRASSRT